MPPNGYLPTLNTTKPVQLYEYPLFDPQSSRVGEVDTEEPRELQQDAALDGPLPEVPVEEEIEGHKSRSTLVAELARRENLTVRELIGRLGGGRGHRTFAGTPEQVADDLEAWFRGGAADGFNVMPPALPGDLSTFADHVVPILRQRGLVREDYETTTLRGHYGLERPGHEFPAESRVSVAA